MPSRSPNKFRLYVFLKDYKVYYSFFFQFHSCLPFGLPSSYWPQQPSPACPSRPSAAWPARRSRTPCQKGGRRTTPAGSWFPTRQCSGGG